VIDLVSTRTTDALSTAGPAHAWLKAFATPLQRHRLPTKHVKPGSIYSFWKENKGKARGTERASAGGMNWGFATGRRLRLDLVCQCKARTVQVPSPSLRNCEEERGAFFLLRCRAVAFEEFGPNLCYTKTYSRLYYRMKRRENTRERTSELNLSR
jgi:hypothetical protein